MTFIDKLREAEKSWNVATITTAIVDMLQAEPEMTLLDIEDMFRAMGSKTTYLAACPASRLPPYLEPRKLDHVTPTKYALWICVNGQDDLLEHLSRFGMTIEQNRAALRECGFNHER